MSHSFFGGIHPDDGKALSANMAIEVLPAPKQVVIPMSLHIGAPCSPLVNKGDYVKLGQKIGDVGAPVSAPIHASVSGTVVAVEPRPHPNGTNVMSIVIENDGLDTLDESVVSHLSENLSDSSVFVKLVREAGIVGMGGATFPTHFKISTGIGKVDTIIINAAECEPYITSDYRTLLEKPEEVISGIKLLMNAFGLSRAYLAVEANKMDAIKVLQDILSKQNSGIEIIVMKARYPQGSEKQLIQTVTGRQVPPGGLPADVGCVVINTYTAWSVNRAITEGMPAIDRVVTVSGPGIASPKNLRARIGTPIEYLIEAAGGFKPNVNKVLMGGPMMGNAQYDMSVPVIKGTNAITVLTTKESRDVENPTCIRCGKCISVCPMHLMPIYMYMYERRNDFEALNKYNLLDCMECGSCTYICPGRLNLVQSFRTGKAKLANERAKQQAAKA